MDTRQNRSSPGPDIRPELTRIAETLRHLTTALKSHRLYGGSGPATERFLVAARESFASLWRTLASLRLDVDESALLWEGEPLSLNDATEIAAALHGDGIRALTLSPGFEREIEAFLGALAHPRRGPAEDDDLITLLWQAQLLHLRYEYVEPMPEGLEVQNPATPIRASIDSAMVRDEVPSAASRDGVSTSDFQETLYFLDDAELRTLHMEVQRELARDLWGDIIRGLADRLEDSRPALQEGAAEAMVNLLPTLLTEHRLDAAGTLLEETTALCARPGLLPEPIRTRLLSVFEQIGTEESIEQIAGALEQTSSVSTADPLAAFLGHFPSTALAPLIRAATRCKRHDVRRALEHAVDRLAAHHAEAVLELLRDPDTETVKTACRYAGRLHSRAAVAPLIRLLQHPDPDVRIAAVEALRATNVTAAGEALLPLLDSVEAPLRIAAVSALAALRTAAARPALEKALGSREIRRAERTERNAFYEAYGILAGSDAIPLLEHTLTGRRWLGGPEPTEIRAAAALGLGQIHDERARSLLRGALHDPDPVIRSAATRALRGAQERPAVA